MISRLLTMLILVAALVACATTTPRATWAQRVERLRGEADRLLAERRLSSAEQRLRAILELEVPADAPAARATHILQDTFFALGRVLFAQGRYEEVVAQVAKGLALGDGDTVFVANLHALRAMALEAIERPLDAIRDYQRAQAIHKRLFDEAVAEGHGAEG